MTRWLAGSAALVIVAQEQALQHLQRVRRSLIIPFPVRERRVDGPAARAALGLQADAVVTLVMGGSQGSATLNREAPTAFASLAERYPALTVLHSAGHGNSAAVRVQQGLAERYHVVDFLDAATAWAAADLAITRAGIGTLSEAAFHGVPLIMIPLPSSAEDHQLHNARAVAKAGAGVVVEESDLALLVSAWEGLLDPAGRRAAAAAAAGRTPVGAARRILEAVMELT